MNDLSNNTLFIGKVAIHLSSVDSTNQFAHNLMSKTNPIEGTAIIADEQYAGRGQFGSSWIAASGENITMSVILCPKSLLVKQQFVLNAAMSLGVYDFINEVLEKPVGLAIKWPNDIYIGEKKIAGMLIENILKGSYLDKTIVGMGINVNQGVFDPTLANPTSMFLYSKKKYEINKILFQLYAALERQYLRIQAGKTKEIISDYTNRLFQIEMLAKYKITTNQEVVEGVIVGVDELGRLLLKINGTLSAFDLKQIAPFLGH